MTKKEYTLEEYEKYYKDKIKLLYNAITEARDEKSIDLLTEEIKNLKRQFVKVLLAKPVLQLRQMKL